MPLANLVTTTFLSVILFFIYKAVVSASIPEPIAKTTSAIGSSLIRFNKEGINPQDQYHQLVKLLHQEHDNSH